MKKIEALIPLVQPYYPSGDPAHDWPHVGRVVANAKKIAKNKNVNLSNLLAAAYCHDIVNLPKDHPERKLASTFAAKEAHGLLKKADYSEEEIRNVQQIIIEHSFSKGLKPSSLEAAIVQDADRLDALGAIGILRCASVNTLMKSTFYDPLDPMAEARPLNDKEFMIDHYFVKLFKLPELMNTEEGKKIAEQRVQIMKDFLNSLMSEIRS
jgi:uncharacterized protein